MIILRKIKSDNKLLDLYFRVCQQDDILSISIADNQSIKNDSIIEIPCVNIDSAIYFMEVIFPINFRILKYKKESFLINERLFETMLKSQKLILDFFSPILEKLNLKFVSIEKLKDKLFVEKIFQELNLISNNFEIDSFNFRYYTFNKSLLILYIFELYTNKLVKNSQYRNYIKNKELQYCNILKNINISFKKSNDFKIDEHLKIINNKMKHSTPNYYFISNKSKFRKMLVKKINLKTVLVDESATDLLFDKNIIKISYYPPNLEDCTKKKDFFSYLISESKNIIISMFSLEKKINKSITIEEISKIKDVKSYIINLFKDYTFPIKYNRRSLEEVFEKIIFISIYHSNDILILIDNKLYLHPEIISEIPNKVKTLYFNILKIFNQSRNNNFESIYFNTKVYLDNIHYEVLKIICEKETLLNKLDESFNLKKIIDNFKLLNKLKAASKIINWRNIPKKIGIFKLLMNNKNIIFYKDKINKNILSDNCDNRLKKVLKDPLEMFKFLKSDKDYIKWIEIIGKRISNLYYNQFNISEEKYPIVGKILYLINSVEEQKFSNKKYSELINLSKKNKNLILEEFRINLKIKEYFNNNNINLGYLAKHINSSYNEPTSFSNDEEDDIITEIDNLKNQLKQANKKYYKYKNKYHKLKTLTNTETTFDTSLDI